MILKSVWILSTMCSAGLGKISAYASWKIFSVSASARVYLYIKHTDRGVLRYILSLTHFYLNICFPFRMKRSILSLFCFSLAWSVRGMQNEFGELRPDDFHFVHPGSEALNYGWTPPPPQSLDQDMSHLWSNINDPHFRSHQSTHDHQVNSLNQHESYSFPMHLDQSWNSAHQHGQAFQHNTMYPHQAYHLEDGFHQAYHDVSQLGHASGSNPPRYETLPLYGGSSQGEVPLSLLPYEGSYEIPLSPTSDEQMKEQEDIPQGHLEVVFPPYMPGISKRPRRFDLFEWQKQYDTFVLMRLYKALAEYWQIRPKETLVNAFQKLNQEILPSYQDRILGILSGNHDDIAFVANKALPRSKREFASSKKTAVTPQQFFNWIVKTPRNKKDDGSLLDEHTGPSSSNPYGRKGRYTTTDPNEPIKVPIWKSSAIRPEKLDMCPWQRNYDPNYLLQVYAKLASRIGVRATQTMRDIFDRLNITHLPKYLDKFPDILNNDSKIIEEIIKKAAPYRQRIPNVKEGTMTPQEFVDWILLPIRRYTHHTCANLEAEFGEKITYEFVEILRRMWRYGGKDISSRLENVEISVLRPYVTDILGSDVEKGRKAMRKLKNLLYGKRKD